MDLPDAISDLHRALLGPLSLADEIFGALIPGCIFTGLLLFKANWAATRAMAYPLLGYKTKIACALIASYVFGKTALSVVTLAQDLLPKLKRKKPQVPTEEPPKERSALDILVRTGSALFAQAPEYWKVFLGGLATGFVKLPILDHYAAERAASLFHLSTGLILALAALVPGDGTVRILEAVIGLILLTRGLVSVEKRKEELAGLAGLLAGSSFAGLQPGQLSKLSKGAIVAAHILTLLAKTRVSAQGEVQVPPTEGGFAATSGAEKPAT